MMLPLLQMEGLERSEEVESLRGERRWRTLCRLKRVVIAWIVVRLSK